MRKKAIIFDLDNTIYSVHSIGEKLFASLFELIIKEGRHGESIEKIRDEIMRRPFQFVASDYGFSEELTGKGIALLKDLEYEDKIEPFQDYSYVKSLYVDKYLVTTGFLKLQQSKVARMKLERDFKEIHIVDPLTSERTKRDVFIGIMEKHGYSKGELLVVGDDLNSEIKAAQELGIDAVLYDHFQLHTDVISLPRISDFKQLEYFLK